MKKTRFLALCTLLATVILSASTCGGSDEPSPTPTPTPSDASLEAVPSSLSFDYAGGKQSLTLKASAKPSVYTQDQWIKVSAGAYSNSSMSVEVSAEENNGATVRTGTIYANITGKTLSIPVSQNYLSYDFSVDTETLDFEYAGGSAQVNVVSTGTPSVSCKDSWCGYELGQMSSDHITPIAIKAGVNLTSAERKTEVKLSYGSDSKTITVSQTAVGEIEVAHAEELTPQKVFETIGLGWNMGNHFDAISNGVSGETLWGNPKCTQATFDGVKAAGFKSVRIPITWMGQFGGAPDYKIKDAWMDRIAEVVGYAHNAGLVTIINMHHDENHADDHWQDIAGAANNAALNETIKSTLFALWTQIAERFKDCGEWLIFEPFNELNDGGWGWSSEYQANPSKQNNVLNEWLRVFVTAVRATGGENATRWLTLPGYCANIDFTIKGLVIPEDYVDNNRFIVAVHDYDPYNYTLNDNGLDEFGHTAAADKCGGKESEVTSPMAQVKEAYLDKGIPVYIGEMGCSMMTGERGIAFKKYYHEYFVKACHDYGLPAVLWDNGAEGAGNEHHGYIHHGTGKYMSDSAKAYIDLMVKAMYTSDPSYTLDSVYNSAPYSD